MCAGPFQSYGGEFLHKTEIEWAAVFFHGIICGHAFTDGCKRTGVLMAAALLVAVGWVADVPAPHQIEAMEGVAPRAASTVNFPVEEIVSAFAEIFGPNARENADGEAAR